MEGRVAAGCWDGRFVLGHGAVLPDGVTVGAAGRGIERALRGGIPSAVVETFPALWRGARRLSVPHLGFFAEKGMENLMFDFVPAAPVSVSNRWMNVYLT
jgi:tRNA(Ile)-lysidine synthase